MDLKTCRVCFQVKDFEEFSRAANNTDGHKNTCKTCAAVRDAAWYRNGPQPKPPVADPKPCKACGGVKPLDAFALDTSHADGHKHVCRECKALRDAQRYQDSREATRARNSAYDAANPHSVKARSLRRRERLRRREGAGVVTESDALILKDFYGECLACGATEHLQVDHVVPVASGGGSDWLNLQVLCSGCNSTKFTRATDYRNPVRGKAIGRVFDMPLVYREFATVTLRHGACPTRQDEPELVA